MLSNMSKLECKIGEDSFQLMCNINASTANAKEALFQFIHYVMKIEEEARASEQKKNEEPKEEILQVEE